MTPAQYESYFKDIAVHHRDILHSDVNPSVKKFTRMNIDEVLTSQRGSLDVTGYCFILENFDGELKDNISDNILDYQNCAFWIIRHFPNKDFEKETEYNSKCLEISMDVITKMRKDKRENTHLTVLRHFDINSVGYNKINNVLDGCTGWRVQFQLFNPLSLAWDPSKWTY